MLNKKNETFFRSFDWIRKWIRANDTEWGYARHRYVKL